MRMIDADHLVKGLRESTILLNGNTLVPVNLLMTLIEKMPTAFDVGKVVENLEEKANEVKDEICNNKTLNVSHYYVGL